MKRFRSVETIGFTQFSHVQTVEDQKTGKIYIKKTLRDAGNPILYHQFLQEIEILSSLKGTFFPYLVDVIEEDELSIIKQWIPGLTLDQWLQTNPKRSLRKKILLELLEHIQSLHEQDYLYIDWKETNLIVEQDQIFLIDFNGCIPKNTSQILVGSSQIELPQVSKYDEQADFQLARPILQKIYPHQSKISITQLQKRLQKKANRLVPFGILFCLLISVCLWIPKPTSKSLIETYTAQDRPLYSWIENQIFETQSLSQKECEFFIREAIHQQDPSICAYFLAIFPNDIDPVLKMLLRWSAMEYESLNEENLDQLLYSPIGIEQKDLLIEVCLQNRIYLTLSQQEKLFADLQNSLEGKKKILQYILFLKSENQDTIDMPETLWEGKESDKEWEDLQAIYESTNLEKEMIWNNQ